MRFARKKVSMAQIQHLLPPMRSWLQRNCALLEGIETARDEYYSECYLIDANQVQELYRYQPGQFTTLELAKVMGIAPVTPDRKQYLLWVASEIGGFDASVSAGFVRLPKLSHLITLTPEDFFSLFRLLANSKRPTPNSLSLDPHQAGIEDFQSSIIYPFFELLKTNYRISRDYMDKKWTPNDAIALIAALEPTRDNQLSAMQYLTAIQNSDLLYFPVETVVELQLDWDQVSEEYCVPPDQGGKNVFSL